MSSVCALKDLAVIMRSLENLRKYLKKISAALVHFGPKSCRSSRMTHCEQRSFRMRLGSRCSSFYFSEGSVIVVKVIEVASMHDPTPIRSDKKHIANEGISAVCGYRWGLTAPNVRKICFLLYPSVSARIPGRDL